MEWWQSLILAIVGLGVFGDILAHIFLPSRRKEDRAKAAKTEADTISILHDVMKTQAQRVKSQNDIIDGKTDQIRELTKQAMASEHTINSLNEKLLKLTEENGRLKVQVEHYKMWICKRPDCQAPRGGRPPRKPLEGLQDVPPE